jgi:hypothetical protein
LPVDPYLYNATSWWWDNNRDRYEDVYDDPIEGAEVTYSVYQDWMREQGVIIREPNAPETGLFFVDQESMTVFVLRWA